MAEMTTTSSGILAYLYYEDVAAAIEWLTKVFGLRERFRINAPNGYTFHAELELGGSVVMLGALGPVNAGPPPERVRSGVYAFVQDVDRHHETARDAGAQIVSEPEDQPFGDRIYLTRDLEGHEWYFAQHVRDVSIVDIQRLLGGAD
jgi:uncharacterized glyoxalase superfamily protein PhnB